MPNKPRILLVEDEPTTLALTAEILAEHAEVVPVADAVEALRLILSAGFEMLVTDLRLQHSFDGLLLAATMRYCHPTAFTVLVTGLPDFTRAVRDVQSNLDLTLVKPVGARQLEQLADLAKRERGWNHRSADAAKVSIWDLIERHQSDIIESWYQQVIVDPRFEGVTTDRKARLDHLPALLRALTRRREKIGSREHVFPAPRSPEEREASRQHGIVRKAQGYLPHWMSLETSYLRQGIVTLVLNELMGVEMATFEPDLLELYERLDESLLDSLQAYGLEPSSS